MAVSDLKVIKDRIRSATPESPIAVFKSGATGKLLAVFGSTVRTQAIIEAGKADLVGMFDSTMPEGKVHAALMAAMISDRR